jgi:DNA (cytosine-5)-methyltransferase 1
VETVARFNSLKLFSGAGGLALGLAKAGFHHVALVELDAYCCDTLRENRARELEHVRSWNFVTQDAKSVDFRVYAENVDLVAGGPPCQPFSICGKHRGFDDTRDMFPQAIRAVAEIRPKAFIFENVPGLLRPLFRNYVEYIRLRLESPSFVVSQNVPWQTNPQRLQRHASSLSAASREYQVFVRSVNAADYGIPQKRNRVFFVGFRSDLNANWFFPRQTHSEEALLIEKFVTGAYWEHNQVPKRERSRPELPIVGARRAQLKAQGAPTAYGSFVPFTTVPKYSIEGITAISSLDRNRRFPHAAKAKEKQVALPAPLQHHWMFRASSRNSFGQK